MKTAKTKSFFALALTVAVGAAVSAPQGGGGGIFDDAVLLLQGDMDVNGDGLVTQGEALNALNRNGPADDVISLQVRGSSDGTTKGFANPVTEVALPRRGRTVTSRVLRFKTQTRQYADGRDAAWASGLTLRTGFPMSETMEMSAVVRFRWDGYVSRADGTAISSVATLLAYGHKYNGIHCSIKKWKDRDWLEFSNWGMNAVVADEGFGIQTNVWYDLAFTATKDQIQVYLFPQGHWNYARIKQKTLWQKPFTDDAFAADESVFGVGTGIGHTNGNDLYYPQETWSTTTMEGFQNNFNGDIHSVAVWNRVLSAEEIEEAFMGGEAADCQIGVANGSNAEFASSADAASVWTETDGWLRFKGELAAVGDCATWRLTNREPSAHARICQVALCAPTQRGRLAFAVNGTPIGEADFFGGGNLVFDIPADAVRPGEANDFSLTLLSGGPAAIDAITVGGGFAIQMKGSDANSDGHLLDEDPKNFTSYLTSKTGHLFKNRLSYRFSLPRAFAARRMRWTVTRQKDHGADAAGYAVFVNGQNVCSRPDLMPLAWTFRVPRGALQEGLNTLVISNMTTSATDGGYYSLASLTGEPLPDRGGLVIIR